MNRVRKEELGNGVWLYTAPFCPVMTDSLLLASFSAGCAAPSSGKKKICAVDLGTGCGILPFLWSKNPRFASILGIELQQEACCLAQKAANEQEMQGRLQFICQDLRQSGQGLQRESFDLVACNPPYFQRGGGDVSADPLRASARTETTCSLEEITSAAFSLLRFGGVFCLCHRPERLCDVLQVMRRFRLEPKKLQMVQPWEGKAPNLVMICGKKGGRPGLKLLPVEFLMPKRGRRESK